LIAGGGTGGHVYPAIAIADAIRAREPEARVVFAGTEDRLEARAVPEAGYALHPIAAAGIPREVSTRLLRVPGTVARGLAQGWRLVGAIDPDVAVGTGGYVAGPALLAARMRGRPLLIQEQNAYAGLTNRVLSLLAERVHVAFPEAAEWMLGGEVRVTGNPTREALRRADPAEARRALGLPPEATVLLVFGGSLGSAAINAALERHVDALLEAPGTYVLWQTGTRYHDALSKRVEGHPRLQVAPYIDRMDRAYAVADLALCRAGALTCSELMVTGTPAVLVPSPNVTADHQTKNARSMERVGAAKLLPEDDLEARLPTVVGELLADGDALAEMGAAAREEARPDAADVIAEDVLAIARRRREEREAPTGG
jgi:UDP-N-acetylglucosamine--N-acetylmuramyl-(pentapeptide) pyrophosphoryl-undecaprenol N-acetylglucosamine transferase